jgi:hypothetical protein
LNLILRGGLESLHEGGWTNGGVLSGRKLVSGFLGKAGWRNTELEIGMSKANGMGYRLPESLKLITCINNARSREMGKRKRSRKWRNPYLKADWMLLARGF